MKIALHRPFSIVLIFLVLPALATIARAGISPMELVAQGDAWMQRSRDEMQPKFYAHAEEAYRKALALEPDNAQAMLGLAWVHNSEHEFPTGKLWAQRALAIDENLVGAYSLLGDAAFEYGEYDEAYDHYQKALDLRPDLSTYSRAALLAWTTGNEEAGKELMRLAISAGGPAAENTAWCYAQLGMMLFQEGDLDAAKKTTARALKGAPENPLALAMMGELKAAEGRAAEALTLFEKSARLSPGHIALSNLVDLYQASGMAGKADKAHDELIHFHEHHHHSPAGHHHHAASAELALFWAERDIRTAEALAQAQVAYEEYPNVRTADALAWCYYKTGRLDEARRYSDEALAEGTPLAKFHYHSGMIHKALGGNEKARKELESALRRNPYFDLKAVELARSALADIASEQSS